MNAKRKRKPKAVVICSGCGGGALGLQRAGYEVVLAIDLDPDDVVNRNHELLTGVRPVKADAMKADYSALCREAGHDPRSIALVLASPPCDGICVAGQRDHKDVRNEVIKSVPARASKAFPQAALVVENVGNLLSDEMAPVLAVCLKNIKQSGRVVPTPAEIRDRFVLESANFGVAQRRRRVFIPAMPRGKMLPTWPSPTHNKEGNDGLLKWVAFGDALAKMTRDPDPRFPPFYQMEYACYLERDSEWTQSYIQAIQESDRRKHGIARPAEKFFLLTDPTQPLPCLTSHMRVPGRRSGLHPSGKRYLTIGELMVAAFGFPQSSGPMDGGVRNCWDMLADAIIPKVAELVGSAIL